MFNQKEVEAYRNISAPDALRDKVLSSCADAAPRKRSALAYRKWASSIAACFVLVMALAALGIGRFANVSVSLSDSKLAHEQSVEYRSKNGAKSISVYRDGGEETIPLFLDGRAELSVSDGIMYIMDPETEEVLYTGTEYSMDGKTLVRWTINARDDAHPLEMTVRGVFKTEKIILTYDASEETWTVTRKDAE